MLLSAGASTDISFMNSDSDLEVSPNGNIAFAQILPSSELLSSRTVPLAAL